MFRRFLFFKQLLVLLFVLTIGIISTSKESEAATINVYNPYNQKMNVAVVYFDDHRQQWLVSGWYSVAANSSRQLVFSSAKSKNSIWLHAYTEGMSVGGYGDNPRWYTVVNEVFKYVAGQNAPDGSNRRKVGFDRYYLSTYGGLDFYP